MLSLPTIQSTRFHKFASEQFPLRPSKVAQLVRCPGSVVLGWVEETEIDTLGGTAAQTGNLVHDGVEGFHKNNNDVEQGARALDEARAKFPGGDAGKAKTLYDAYVADEENKIIVPYVELPVCLSLAPLADDPSGLPVVIKGTCDQIRRNATDGKLYLWDIKTGSRLDINQTLDYYAYQLSTYCVAATQTIGETVHPGGIIYTEGYTKLRGRTRIFCPWHYDTALHHMAWVQRIVTEVRKGNVPVTPGAENCKYCPHQSIQSCTPKLRELYG